MTAKTQARLKATILAALLWFGEAILVWQLWSHSNTDNRPMFVFVTATTTACFLLFVVTLINVIPYVSGRNRRISGTIERRFKGQGSNGTVRFFTYFLVVKGISIQVSYEEYETFLVGDHIVVEYFQSPMWFRKIIRPYWCRKNSAGE